MDSTMSQNVQQATSSKNVQRLNQSVGLWLSDAMAVALQRAAQADDRNLSSYIRVALTEKLRREGFLNDDHGVAA